MIPVAAAVLLLGLPAEVPAPGETVAETPASLRARVEEARAQGVRWLLDHQAASGSFGSHQSPRPIEVLADVPGSHQAFRVATTALCVVALQDAGGGTPEVEQAIGRGLDALLAECDVKRPNGFEHYNVWSFGYTLHCFGERLRAAPDDPHAAAMRAACDRLVEKLGRYQALDGGFGYLSLGGIETYQPSWTSMSFTTATILIGLERAAAVGIEVPEAMLERALDSVARTRTPTGSFTYGEIWNRSPARGINQWKGAACRGPACLLALEGFGRPVTMDDHRQALDALLVKHARFQVASLRRPIPHESWYSVSGYFYLYGHAYAAYALEQLDAPTRARLTPLLAEAVLRCRQPDGSFWDYPLYSYHKPYGTAFALIALARTPLDG